MLVPSKGRGPSEATVDFASIVEQLKGNQYRPVKGGFTNALRGIIKLSDLMSFINDDIFFFKYV